jgi:hypothetical protein
MARSDLALAAARAAYTRAHVWSALRGLALTAAIAVIAVALHRESQLTWALVVGLAAVLATFGWRGGAWRRGAFAGVLAGLPPLVMPTLVFALGHGGHCPSCTLGPTLGCIATCFGTSALVGLFVGHAAVRDAAPQRFALAAVASAMLTGMLGCTTVGFAGALGIAVGFAAGGVAGWVVAAGRAPLSGAHSACGRGPRSEV